jgi:hypothetical protein
LDWEQLLPQIVSRGGAWAEEQAEQILRKGSTLDEDGRRLARCVGVGRPDDVRILLVKQVPAPADPLLREACQALGFLGAETAGLTIGHGIFLRKDRQDDPGLLAHELRHVAQYEAQPSISAYLAIYIPDLVRYGYSAAPFEIDAYEAAKRCISNR